jgi:lipocalin-like protein
MSAINSDGRKPLWVADRVSTPAEERAQAYSTFMAYVGRYTYTGDRVVHHVDVASVQTWVNTDGSSPRSDRPNKNCNPARRYAECTEHAAVERRHLGNSLIRSGAAQVAIPRHPIQYFLSAETLRLFFADAASNGGVQEEERPHRCPQDCRLSATFRQRSSTRGIRAAASDRRRPELLQQLQRLGLDVSTIAAHPRAACALELP